MESMHPYAIVNLTDSTPEKPCEEVIIYYMEASGDCGARYEWSARKPYHALYNMGRQAWQGMFQGRIIDFTLPPNLYTSTIVFPFLEGHTFATRTLNKEELLLVKKTMRKVAGEQGYTIFSDLI